MAFCSDKRDRSMQYFLIYFAFIPLILTLTSCKKKTSTEVVVFNYALNEPVENASVVLLKRDEGIFGLQVCIEEITETTDKEGKCFFDNAKLKSGKKHDYFIALKAVYGEVIPYNCEGRTVGKLKKGEANFVEIDASNSIGSIKVQYHNILNPSQKDDSLIVKIKSAVYYSPSHLSPAGGDLVFDDLVYNNINGSPFPDEFTRTLLNTPGGKKIITVRKRKLGVVTESVDTVKIYPNKINTVMINW